MNFKIELWDIENGVVVTRPVVVDKDQEGQPIYKSSSVWRDDGLLALKEAQAALDILKAEYQKKLNAAKTTR